MADRDRGIEPERRMFRAQKIVAVVAIVAFLFFVFGGLSAVGDRLRRNESSSAGAQFAILTGTENRALFENPDSDEPSIMERFAQQEGIEFVPSYQGSVDTMMDLQTGALDYDAVWPASSIWLDLGDTKRVVSQTSSIMGTPVVFGIKRSKAEELGWIGKDVSVDDILAAAESGQLDFMMSSATQSNSGAMAYLGYLYAFAGHPDVLTSEMLHDPEVADKLTRILGSVERTAGASGFLRDLFLENYADYDGMVNNESAIINANQRLIARGEADLLYVVYPVDGLAIADWPLGFVDHGDPAKAELFDRLQSYLLSPDVQAELASMGRRTGMGLQMDPAIVDPTVFNPDWGIDVDRVLVPITLPAADVVLEALDLYQTTFRKPSYVVFCLDFSGSMRGDGERDLTAAMSALLDPEQAGEFFLQRTGRDVTIVLPFSSGVEPPHRVDGNDPEKLEWLKNKVKDEGPGGGTDIFGCLAHAQTYFADMPEGYAPAIILMTDGESNEGSFEDFTAKLPANPEQVIPVYSILFGGASRDELEQISDVTRGDIYDGREGLIDAMRDAFANT
jgi:Ca-activated chloride channel family protein